MSKLREYLEALLIAVIFLKFANTFVVQTFYIPSSSMEETLLVGDHLFVNRFIFGPAASALERRLLPSRPVRRGDVVIFRSVEDPTVDVVKRCVALPGDTVEIVAKRLYLNGELLDESDHVVYREPYSPGRDKFGPFVVPEGHYFLLGDNRDLSHDSRFWGALPAHYVEGRAVMIYWSYGEEEAYREPAGSRRGEAAEPGGGLGGRLGRVARGFFTETRWGRTFHLIR